MANGKYWRDDPYYFSAVNLDRDVPDEEDAENWDDEEDEYLDEEAEDGDPRDPDEDEEEDDWEDMEDDTHSGGSHRASEGNTDWSGYYEDLD